jgi:hypothetical protein
MFCAHSAWAQENRTTPLIQCTPSDTASVKVTLTKLEGTVIFPTVGKKTGEFLFAAYTGFDASTRQWGGGVESMLPSTAKIDKANGTFSYHHSDPTTGTHIDIEVSNGHATVDFDESVGGYLVPLATSNGIRTDYTCLFL